MKNSHCKGEKIFPPRIEKDISVTDLVEKHFGAYNAARLSEICRLLAQRALKDDVTLGVSLTGALTPAGLGASCIVPLIENGFIDYLVTTGANLYHDIHFGLGLPLHKSSPFLNDVELKKGNLVRIYDIIFDYEVLLKSDKYLYRMLEHGEFHKNLTTSELHYLLGAHIDAEEKKNGREGTTVLAAAYRAGVPVYCPSPGDSTIGLNMAARALYYGESFGIDVLGDVHETTAIVYEGHMKGENGVLILGGGSPKNFILQTIPQLDEVMDIPIGGHDYFMQITDARPDTGGLSGATPSEAITWGKLNPSRLPQSVVAYLDTTIALPVITAYVLSRCAPREHKRFFDKRKQLVEQLATRYREKGLLI